MAGYSGTPLWRKLGMTPGMSLVAVGEVPGALPALLDGRPADTDLRVAAGPPSSTAPLGESGDIAVVFTTRREELVEWWPAVTTAVGPNGAVWVAWPKRASKVATDITEDVIRAELLASGWVDVKVCAIDETWSGLKLVLRRELRP
jgi:hypothetical protein